MSTAPSLKSSVLPGPSSGKGGRVPRCRPDRHRRGRWVATWWGLPAAREAAGLNKKELAQRAGLSRETVNRIETLKRPAEPATVRAAGDCPRGRADRPGNAAPEIALMP